MKQESIEIITLTASDGYMLTNGKTYSEKVYLGINDNPDNWWEVPENEVPEESEEIL